ncbi:DegV family protein [Mycoplasmopsis lipofaciens]|uniref:DegV family protein n=1 Tax=Mycoplasmopsis lipofaciens TaxID=114884 RepID=UPI000482C802|nr:DegV family protein [Mycoplasmopsis lipofaciens]
MKKIGFIFDSFISEQKTELDKKGFGYFPFRCILDEVEYEDGIDLEKEELLHKIDKSKDVKTSLARYSTMEEVISKMTKEYDDVLYLPIGQNLSSSSSTAQTFKREFSNFHVFDNGWVGNQYNYVVDYARRIYEKYQDINVVIEKLVEIKNKSILFVLPLNINYVINGGRISSFKKVLLKTVAKLKLKPYIKFYNGSGSTGGIARGVKSAINQMLTKTAEFANVEIKDLNKYYNVDFIYGIDKEFTKQVIDLCEKHGVKFDSQTLNTSTIAIHTGPEAICFSIIPKLKNKEI